MKRYDIIIAGGGMAGLSLCYYLSQSSLRESSILLIDREPKNQNDRTWCFWESGAGPFESIVFRSWQQVEFYGKTATHRLPIAQSTYKMVRGIDFYTFAKQQLANLPNIEVRYASVDLIQETDLGGIVRSGNETYAARHVFDSITPLNRNRPGNQNLLQHFKGWVITTEQDCFDADCPRIMDFRTEQQSDCRFFYLLPFDKRTALVEYTVFSQDVLSEEEYTDALRNYIDKFINTGGYQIQETERGIIPMTNERPPSSLGKHVVRIGQSGGYTKPSTGYTFQRTQEQLREMVVGLAETGEIPRQNVAGRNWLKRSLDTVFLNVLIRNRHSTADLFSRLFTRNKPVTLFRFMNEESTVWQDMQIINSMPKLPFVRAAVEIMVKKLSAQSVVAKFPGRWSAVAKVSQVPKLKSPLLGKETATVQEKQPVAPVLEA